MLCFLIDDDLDDREFFRIALKTLDGTIELATAENGMQALKRLKTDKSLLPNYIFLDLNMPYMSGRECLAKLREITRLKNVPIILYSTIHDFEELTGHRRSDCITKPNSIAELVKVLKGIIK